MAQLEFFIALLVACYFAASIWWDSRRARHYKNIAHDEKIRSTWAEARAKLIELVRDNKLNVQSDTFKALYQIQTSILRRPEAYVEIAARFRETFLTNSGSKPPRWFREKDSWPDELIEVFVKMANGTLLLALGYPGVGRLLNFFRIFMPWVLKRFANSFSRLTTNFLFFRYEQTLISSGQQMEKFAREKGYSGDSLSLSPG
jgi:hypothetical protein